MSKQKRLLAIIELGGYPNLIPLYKRLGYRVEVVNTQRKASNYLKKQQPDVIVAEYNYQTDFRDRSSNLETLCAVLQRYPEVKLLVFYPQVHRQEFTDFRQQHKVWQAIEFPIIEEKVMEMLADIQRIERGSD
jgi:23S rRNA A2030 N6-methylase RlmJ